MRSDREIVEQADALARRFAEETMGYSFATLTTPIREVRDPRMQLCWNMALVAFAELQQTDVNDALSNLEDDRPHEVGSISEKVVAALEYERSERSFRGCAKMTASDEARLSVSIALGLGNPFERKD